MEIQQRISAFAELGAGINEFLLRKDDSGNASFRKAVKQSCHDNAWFTEEYVCMALAAIAENLESGKLSDWIDKYEISPDNRRVGVVMAGNIPLVGFHDFLCVLITGNCFIGKLSSEDRALLPALTKELINIEPNFKEYIFFEETLHDFDAAIATGSDNSARYFEYHFGKYPHIIRKNRNSVAVLNGNEAEEELLALGSDIFSYFGMGCRSISKIFVPEGYGFDLLFKALSAYKRTIEHSKYANNYNYNKTVYVMNDAVLLDNGFILLKEDKGLASPLATLFYEYYSGDKELEKRLDEEGNKIQCIVSKHNLSEKLQDVPFGKAQRPRLADYADGIDTIAFLNLIE